VNDTEGLRPLFRRLPELEALIDAGFAVLTPNRRLSRAIRQADDARREALGNRAWVTPIMVPERQFWIDRWHEEVLAGLFAPRRVLDVPAQRLLWQRVIERNDGGRFSLLSARRAAALCQAAQERLLLWQIDVDDPRWRSWFTGDDDPAIFRRWLGHFQAELDALEACTPEQALTELHHHLARESAAAPVIPPLVRVLCDDSRPLHRALAKAAPQERALDLPDHRAAVGAIRAFRDAEGELRAAARWCREQVADHPEGRYAVVLQDMDAERAVFETYLRREFGCLTTDYESLPVNFATGFALDRVPLVRDALRIIALGAREIDLEESLALLSSRFIALRGFSTASLELQARKLRDLGVRRLPSALLRDFLDPLVEESQRPAAPWNAPLSIESRGLPLRRRRYPSAWVPVFRALLDAWSWGVGVTLDSLEYQQRVAWEEALDRYAGLDGVLTQLDFEEALTALRTALQEEPFQPRTADRAVQVLGPLETTGLDFDGLWLTGMGASTWPARVRPNPYLPRTLQAQLGMPGANAEIVRNEARRRWAHWQSCTQGLVASFQSLRDEAQQLPSPLVGDVRIEQGAIDSGPDPRWDEAAGAPWVLVDPGAPPLDSQEKAGAGVSSAVLDAQAACPFKAFATARLGTGPATPVVAGLTAAERGTLLHRALQHLLTAFPGQEALRSASADILEASLDTSIETAVQGLARARRRLIGSGALAVEQRRLQRLLAQWLTLERERPDRFTIDDLEAPRSLTLGGLSLSLRIDRIDRLEDGSRLLIDYKTGKPEPAAHWFTDPLQRVQMPLYALAESDAVGIAYAVVRPGELGWRGVGQQAYLEGMEAASKYVEASSQEGADPDGALALIRSTWREGLQSLAEAFLAGESSVLPLEGACRLCGRHALCRIGDQES